MLDKVFILTMLLYFVLTSRKNRSIVYEHRPAENSISNLKTVSLNIFQEILLLEALADSYGTACVRPLTSPAMAGDLPLFSAISPPPPVL